MRKIIVLSFISLDGIMQAPGGPNEDRSGDFQFGGWTVPFWDESGTAVMNEQMDRPYDLLLGRKTYDIFAAYWPNAAEKIIDFDHKDPIANGLNNATKYVVTQSPIALDWKNTIRIEGNVVEGIRKIKKSSGPDLQVHGSGNLIQTLLKHDLVDELWLKTYPVVLGSGKRLFGECTRPSGWELTSNTTTKSGIIVANYRRAGEVRSGSFDQEEAAK
jgi:dihydrofolate reductase